MSNQTEDNTEAEASFSHGIQAAEIENRIKDVYVDGHEHGVPVALVPSGMQMKVMSEAIDAIDQRAAKPRRLIGTSTHTEIDSFIAHVVRFKDHKSVVFADATNVRLTAVFDYHEGPGAPRWSGHRSVYACPLSREWQLWTKNNERFMGQEEFAQFIEDNNVDIRSPTEEERQVFAPQAAILEMARKLSIQVTGEYKREVNQTTGESTFICKTEHGPNSTKIHGAFLLGIPVFDAGAHYRLEARVRFTLGNNRPQFAYSLFRHEAIKRDAFGEVRAKVEKATELPVFCGTPET